MIKILINDNDIIKSGYESIVNWKLNYRSWKSFISVPSLFIKYEDLISNPQKIFNSLIFFLSRYTNVEYNEEKIKKVIDLISFNKLQNLEKKEGFSESHHSKFFFSGKINTWEKLLTKKQIEKIEKNFENEMKELGYL